MVLLEYDKFPFIKVTVTARDVDFMGSVFSSFVVCDKFPFVKVSVTAHDGFVVFMFYLFVLDDEFPFVKVSVTARDGFIGFTFLLLCLGGVSLRQSNRYRSRQFHVSVVCLQMACCPRSRWPLPLATVSSV